MGMTANVDTEEKAARMNALRAKIHENNLEYWSEKFLSALVMEGSVAQRADEDFEI